MVVLGNTVSGWLAGVVALVGSVGYEVLGFGPNWVHAPQFKPPPAGPFPNSDDSGLVLRFDLLSGRPSFLVRAFGVTSNMHKIGTLTPEMVNTFEDHPDPELFAALKNLTEDPRFEYLQVSNRRWEVGRRIAGASISADFGFHHIDTFRDDLCTLACEGSFDLADGFLFSPDDPPVVPPTGISLRECVRECLDKIRGKPINFAHPRVREIILEQMWLEARAFFNHPNYERMPWFIFNKIGLPDGWDHVPRGVNLMGTQANWYLEYRRSIRRPLNQPYRLHGLPNIDQPTEMWDPDSVSDQLAGLANWLLDQFDQLVESRIPDEATQELWKSRTRISYYCYSRHSIPPHFNLNPRVCINFGSGSATRGEKVGEGRWCAFVNKRRQLPEVFQAMGLLSPGAWLVYEPFAVNGLIDLFPARLEEDDHNWVPEEIRARLQAYFDNGLRGYGFEYYPTFGRDGLRFYVISELLWNTTLDGDGLDTLIDRWFQRAFGTGAVLMRRAYEWMYRENLPYNHALAWAEVVDLIDQADLLIDPVAERAQKRRLNDVKLYWYFFYILRDYFKPKTVPDSVDPSDFIWSPEEQAEIQALSALKEYIWKGQMAYAMPIGLICWRIYNEETVYHWLRRLVERFPASEEEVSFESYIQAGPPYYSYMEVEDLWYRISRTWRAIRIKRRFSIRPSRYLERTIVFTIRQGGPGRNNYQVGGLGEPIDKFPLKPGKLPEGYILPELEELDENDLVQVRELRNIAPIKTLPGFGTCFMSGNPENIYFYTVANAAEHIGCHLVWQQSIRSGIESSADYWDAVARRWRVNEIEPSVVPSYAMGANQVATIELETPYPGTYRIRLHANLPPHTAPPHILGLHNDPASEEEGSAPPGGMVFRAVPASTKINPPGSHLYFYVPRHSDQLEFHTHKRLDFPADPTDPPPNNRRVVKLYLLDGPLPTPSYAETDRIRGLRNDDTPVVGDSITPIDQSAPVDVWAIGYYTIDPLADQYKGALLSIKPGIGGQRAILPYFYTLPNWFSPSPNTLLVPRRVAELDGLTIVCPQP